ncbi:carbohydrate ABC transporter permease [Virgibacillus necropolis]|uniref:Cytochrome C biogenesis protein n=1 Tax=Virgibacillus necropolis TaxID=163877 RepID=A0A221M9K2_9BACI|nr:sugar ABC transporter permease [Virgibacillus necropolis]ASN04315.1 cytochrome C biogenesis protein [Virgibacillus necropolis]
MEQIQDYNQISKKEKLKKWFDKITPYIFISPFYILFVVFGLFPIIFSAILAFNKWDGIGDMEFVGMQNFNRLIQDSEFWLSVYNTLIIWIIGTAPMILAALVIAFLINLKIIKYKNFYRTTMFMPYVTSVVAVTILFGLVFSSSSGLANGLLQFLGFERIDFINDPFWVKLVIASVNIWQYIGYNMIIFFTGLQRIPKDYYEAAIIDGASNYQIFSKITIPIIKPIILFVVMMSTIGGIQIFTEAQVLVPTNATAEGGSLTVVYYMYKIAFERSNYGYGATVSWGLVAIIIMFSILNWYLTTKRIKGEE